MYNACFGFTRRPFAAAPQAEHYFPAAAIEAARQRLARCIERAEGAAMVVGPSGTGKTLLCRVLAREFAGSLQVALLASGRLSTRRNLFQAILYELAQPYREMDEGELRLALIHHLTTSDDCARGMLLLVDDAHSLPLRLLEEIRTLTDLARKGQPSVRLVMAGGCALEERLAHPRLDAFAQRLVARCYLESLSRTETQDYIHAQVDPAGGAATRVFPADTCRSVYQATEGVPRLINQVCDHALLLAYAAGQSILEAAHVEEAWADLQQLPAPLSEEGCHEDRGVIEFGGLDDSTTDEEALERSSLPPLRITPETEEADPTLGETTRQLDRIQRMLGNVQDDYQPAGSIGPELELVFDDPFQEDFEKEELVTDCCRPGDEPPKDLTTRTKNSKQDQAPKTTQAADRLPAGPESQADEELAALALAEESLVDQYEMDLDTLPLHRQQPGEDLDDADLVIVEDDDQAAGATCSIVAVRRQEYGRLFTKLRRG